MIHLVYTLFVGLLSFLTRRYLHDDPTVDLGYAKYRGNLTSPNVVTYLGIPYAQPPVGDLRFRAPVPLNTSGTSTEVIDATEYPDFCIMCSTGAAGDVGGAGSEDCLKLNIYARADAKEGSKLPVLFYIHGGGYIAGNPAAWPFEHWIEQSPNVVIVSVYYRLDSLGFLSTPEFAEDSSLGDLNAGLLDQREALRWVQKYIVKFGGDPSRVTINGESAGAASDLDAKAYTIARSVAPDEDLFHSAIAQSVYRTPLPTPSQQKVILLPYRTFHPVLDSNIISEYPTKLITEGKFVQVPLIVGATSNETLAFGGTIQEALKSYFPALTDGDVYPEDDFPSEMERALTVTGESSLRCARTIMGEAFSQTVATWTYRYNQPDPSSNSTLANHAAENWMMFRGSVFGPNGTFTFTSQSEPQLAFAEELIAYWMSFVRARDPNVYKLERSPEWPKYSSEERLRMVLQAGSEGLMSSSGSSVELEGKEETKRCGCVAKLADRQQA
ncbi:Alpha/Beta hydrolase protein [Schizophyllum fasciatum]